MTQESVQTHQAAKGTYIHSGMDTRQSGSNPRRLLLSLWRHKLIVICSTIIVLGLAHLYIALAKPLYQSSARIKIDKDSHQTQEIHISKTFSDEQISARAVRSEVAILKSRSRIKQLARDLGLYRMPDMTSFSIADKRDSAKDGKFEQFKSFNLTPRSHTDKSDTDNTGEPGEPEASVIDRIANNLDVHNIPGTAILEIGYKSPNPDLAAAIPQALAEGYIRQTLTKKLGASGRLRSWLSQRLEESRKNLKAAENRLADFKRENALLIDGQSNMRLNRLIRLNKQIINIKSEHAKKHAKLKQVREILGTDPSKAAATAPLKSATLDTLQNREHKLQNKKAEAMTRYGPKHPRIKAIRAELETVRKQRRKAVRGRVQQLSDKVALLATQLDKQKQHFQDLRQRFNDKRTAAIRLKQLKRNAKTAQEIHERFLKKYKSTIDVRQLKEPDAEIISRAKRPETPVFPEKQLIYALSGGAGIIAGIILSLFMLILRTGYASLHELERDGLETLGIVPLLKKSGKGERKDVLLNEDTKTPIKVSLRNIYMKLRLYALYREKTDSLIVVTSTLSGEGKTSTVGWLAQTAAHAGASVCVIDADMCKPGLHRFFRLNTDRGLVDYLGNHAELDDIIQHSTTTGVDVITSRSAPYALGDPRNSKRIETLFAALRTRYDFVIADTPALLAAPDAAFVTLHADHIAHLVAWEETGSKILESGLKMLSNTPAERISIILSKVDITKQVRQGYSDIMYYYPA